jgi:hypothetical protein
VSGLYDALLRDLTDEARADDEVVGLLLTGSLARGDALPGTDIDLRYILTDGLSRPFDRGVRDGVLVERGFADEASHRAELAAKPMHVYAYLDGRVLFDQSGALGRLRTQARGIFDAYETPRQDKATIAFLLGCSRDKIRVALNGGDDLRAAFVTGTSSWQLVEGLWAANDHPLPPNSSVRPHLRDLTIGPPDAEERFRQLFLGSTRERAETALELIDWIVDRLGARHPTA